MFAALGTNEIKRNPGGGRDISRALRTLPGVAAIPSFRNDIVIRGGAPNENRFYIDGIEIPNINHFATQGASGGPVGMINVDLVENIDFYAGAFPAARGNALSSVMEFSFKEARTDEWTANMVVGTSDLGLTLEGPTGENSSLIFSMRRSYLQFVFEALGLPFLPIYNDYQFKWTARPDDKNAITVIGLGALDDFELNLGPLRTIPRRPITSIRSPSSARSMSKSSGTTPRASGGTTTGTTGNGRWWPAETCSTTEPSSTSTTTRMLR